MLYLLLPVCNPLLLFFFSRNAIKLIVFIILLGVIVPFQRMISILRQNNILSVVDGAHAIGQIPLNIKEIEPDFFATNCHKWLYTPKSSAILYVPYKHQKKIHPSVTSLYLHEGFVSEFSWIGTQDFG